MNGSRALAYVLGAAVGMFPVAPPEHIHDAQEEGHHHVVIHRHWQPHRLHGRAVGRPSTVEDNDDDPILTLAVVYTATARTALPIPPQVVVASIEPPRLERADWRTDEVDLLIHGPPRAPTSLRGPPIALAL